MENETALHRACRLVGGPAALARLLGEKRQTVSNWLSRGEPPANKAVAIEVASGVSRRELRSDWRDYWPENDAPVSPESSGCERRGSQQDRRQVEVPVPVDLRGTKPDRRGAALAST